MNWLLAGNVICLQSRSCDIFRALQSQREIHCTVTLLIHPSRGWLLFLNASLKHSNNNFTYTNSSSNIHESNQSHGMYPKTTLGLWFKMSSCFKKNTLAVWAVNSRGQKRTAQRLRILSALLVEREIDWGQILVRESV